MAIGIPVASDWLGPRGIDVAATLLTSFVRVMNAPQGYDPSDLTVAEFRVLDPSVSLAEGGPRFTAHARHGRRRQKRDGLGRTPTPAVGLASGGRRVRWRRPRASTARRVAPAEATTWSEIEVAPNQSATMKMTIVAVLTLAAVVQ